MLVLIVIISAISWNLVSIWPSKYISFGLMYRQENCFFGIFVTIFSFFYPFSDKSWSWYNKIEILYLQSEME